MGIFKKTFLCSCGKVHNGMIEDYIVEKDAISQTAGYVKKYGAAKAFLVADRNTFAAAGNRVVKNLQANHIPYESYILPEATPKPDEKTIGSVIMHYDASCDIIIGIGSGVVNDLSKILANVTGHPYIIVATAPSMDGYASATSSVDVDGLKISLPSKCANVVIGDLAVLQNAPQRMLLSGLGDMLAKYVSICEWRISHLITGEYYCEEIARLIRGAVKACVDHAEGLLNREETAVKAVFEGLVLGGVAMNYAGLSRPASGVEHYFSHIWDMRGPEFGTNVDFHGIQCAIGTRYAIKLYDVLRKTVPDTEKALAYVQSFCLDSYYKQLEAFLGKGAAAMIALEEKEGKYHREKHSARLGKIVENWEMILKIIDEELPDRESFENLLTLLHFPKTAKEIGIEEDCLPMTFLATKDIRDKYSLSRLCWDLGIIDEICEQL